MASQTEEEIRKAFDDFQTLASSDDMQVLIQTKTATRMSMDWEILKKRAKTVSDLYQNTIDRKNEEIDRLEAELEGLRGEYRAKRLSEIEL